MNLNIEIRCSTILLFLFIVLFVGSYTSVGGTAASPLTVRRYAHCVGITKMQCMMTIFFIKTTQMTKNKKIIMTKYRPYKNNKCALSKIDIQKLVIECSK